jgi:hypothetical protein
MTATLMIGGRAFGSVGPDFLSERLADLGSAARSEVWLYHSGGSSLCLLKSDDRAMLMLHRVEGDSGLVSRASDDFAGGPLRFSLSNGQEDEYPATWTVGFDDARRAMEHFWFGGAPAPFIRWHDDRG